MSIRSKHTKPFDTETKEPKKYLLITYGGPGSGGRPNAPSNLGIGLGGGLFDLIFEKLGIKKKSCKRTDDLD